MSSPHTQQIYFVVPRNKGLSSLTLFEYYNKKVNIIFLYFREQPTTTQSCGCACLSARSCGILLRGYDICLNMNNTWRVFQTQVSQLCNKFAFTTTG